MKSVEKETIAVIGLGYVGLPLAVRSRERGFKVIGIDCDKPKVARINAKKSPHLDANLAERLTKVSLEATTDFSRMRDASIAIICVPTPVHEDHTPDLGPVISASESIAPHLKAGALVIVESTVNPGVCEDIVMPILTKAGLIPNRTLFLAHCPERINPGDTKWNVGNIPRVVGSNSAEGLRRATNFYETIVDAEIRPMDSIKAAEAVKVVENSFRDINIAFVNELAMSFEKLGIDVVDVINGASTKPFAFMPHFPGCGVGGHCIPVDPYYLIEHGRQNGFAHRFLSMARYINNQMPVHTVDVLESAILESGSMLVDTRVAVLGLAYKPDIDDCRESPAFAVIEEIKRRGGSTVAYDPFVSERSDARTLDEALSQSNAAVVVTAHADFTRLTPRDFARHDVSVVVDGRNCLSRRLFEHSPVLYRGIGRSSRRPQHGRSSMHGTTEKRPIETRGSNA